MTKHFWLRNKITGIEGYCVNLNGALNMLNLKRYETIWLNYNEINKILDQKTKPERYSLCDKLFNEKFPQPKEKQKELSKDEQSNIEELFFQP